MKLTRRGKAVALTAGIIASGVVGFALPVHAGGNQNTFVEYFKVTQDNPTNGITRFIIRGEGCLDAEDMTQLKLVEYAPSNHKVVYRCIQP